MKMWNNKFMKLANGESRRRQKGQGAKIWNPTEANSQQQFSQERKIIQRSTNWKTKKLLAFKEQKMNNCMLNKKRVQACHKHVTDILIFFVRRSNVYVQKHKSHTTYSNDFALVDCAIEIVAKCSIECYSHYSLCGSLHYCYYDCSGNTPLK